MDEFKLNIKLYGNNDLCVLIIYEGNNEKRYELPTEMFPMKIATPEKIGTIITEYLKKHCT